MKIQLIYPKWPKLKNQPLFNLPPHAPCVLTAAMPDSVTVSFTDEHVEPVNFDEEADLVAISCMLTCQLPRAFEIVKEFQSRNKKVIMGGIAIQLHAEECLKHADSVFLGEAEGRMEMVVNDFQNNNLQKCYNYHNKFPDINLVGTADRSILKRNLYNYRGVQMVDLVHASRGCKFNCFPCCSGYLGGKQFRPRPVDKFIEELAAIENNRLFVVDNSLAQDKEWLRELFTAMIPMKKKWVSHPIIDDEEIIKLAKKAGCWYVYLAVVDRSDFIRTRIKRLKDNGISVEGTVIIGTDDHDEDEIKRFVDFLMDIDLDLAEFTVMTPFPHSPIRDQMEKENRILSNDWIKYNAGEVVFQPAKMSPDKLQEMFEYAWKTFYSQNSLEIQMAKLYLKTIREEQKDGTYKGYDIKNRRVWGR